MIVFALAAALATAPVQAPPAPQSRLQDPPAATAAPVQLEDVEVTGASLDSLIRSFVNEVAAPNRRHGIARWDDRICIGVANLRTETAQYLIDRVSTVAGDLGVFPGEPGCRPNLIIIASDDPDGLARELTQDRPRAFRMGGSGMDQGGDALEDFVNSDAPVRWWQVSMPADSETGQRATRIPGECSDACQDKTDNYAPLVFIASASRLSTQIVDYIFRTVVILDIDQVSGISGQQLADYLAMVSLAQIDPTADTSRFASILNVFESPDTASGLTDWDQAYLTGLYGAERTRRSLRAGTSEIADSIHRAHQDSRDAESDAEPDEETEAD